MLYVRDPRERVEKVAPFLEVDGDPYPAVVAGRITWIVDAYTTSDSYPYAEQTELGEAAQDALTGTGTTALPDETVNYIRNSVKATVDAYDGTVTLYEWDTQDPVLQTHMKAFPGVVQQRSDIPDALLAHVRYPQDLFKVQRDILTRYHVDDPVDFYNANNRWQIPDDPTRDTEEDQPPYYILAQRPGDDEATFQLTSALNAFQRDNLSAFISASSDPETYGEIQVLRLPGNTPFRGPAQVQNAFESNNQVRPDLTLFDSENSEPVFGNLLTLPIGDAGLLYVTPLYVRGTNDGGFPLLQKVLVNYADRIGYADTLDQALDQVFGAGADEPTTAAEPPPPDGGPVSTPPPGGGPEPTPPPGAASATADGGGPTDARLTQAVTDIDTALDRVADAQRSGDLTELGQALVELGAAVAAYQLAAGATSAG